MTGADARPGQQTKDDLPAAAAADASAPTDRHGGSLTTIADVGPSIQRLCNKLPQ